MTPAVDPFSESARKRLVLRRGRERTIANRHPWVFDGAISSASGPDDAAVADLVDHTGNVLASGFYSPASQIRLRVISFAREGAEAAFDAALLRQRIAAAIRRRDSIHSGHTNAVRLVNSEGDGLSGLVVDRYDDVLVVEIGCHGVDRLRDFVVETLSEIERPRAVILHNDIAPRRLEKLSLESRVYGEDVAETIIRENGLGFHVSFRAAQKTGLFLDQRDNRTMARDLAAGREVLNLFSYTGGFGVYAASGGASAVLEVDSSAPAIELARRNHALNGSECVLHLEVADAFARTRELVHKAQTFSLLICDPPAFAKTRNDVDRAARGYKDINMQAFKLARPGALVLTFSCSGHVDAGLFQKIIFAAALDAGREVSILRRLGAGEDHPVSVYCPEGEYLKGFLLRVEA